MKAKKITAAFLAVSLLFAAVGCSKDDSDKRNGRNRGDDEVSEEEDNDRRRDYDDNRRVQSDLSGDWLNGEPWFIDVNGIEITDTGRFEFPMGDIAYGGETTGFPAFVKIEQNYDGCEDGYKNVVATCTFLDDSGTGGMWISVFDKYMGYTFECSDHTFELYEGCYDVNYSSKDFTVGDHDVHVEWTLISEQQEYVATLTMIVKCPEDYNGCVFMYGPLNSNSPIDSCDLDNQLYDINDIDYSGDEYVYFTLEALPLQST